VRNRKESDVLFGPQSLRIQPNRIDEEEGKNLLWFYEKNEK